MEAAFGSAGAAGNLGTATLGLAAVAWVAGAASLGRFAAIPGPDLTLGALDLSKKSLPISPAACAMVIAVLSLIPRASLYGSLMSTISQIPVPPTYSEFCSIGRAVMDENARTMVTKRVGVNNILINW